MGSETGLMSSVMDLMSPEIGLVSSTDMVSSLRTGWRLNGLDVVFGLDVAYALDVG
jgi:hypothetical protein